VPGTNGVVADPVNCQRLTVYNLDPAVLALPIRSRTTHNSFVPNEHFLTWELSGTKRMTHHWSLNASYTATWSAQAATPQGLSAAGRIPTNPNQFLGAESDNLFHFTTTQGKVTSTFELPFDMKVAEVLRFQAGQPWGRTVTIRMNYGNETIQVEPTSSRRSDNITILDLRLEKSLNLAASKRFRLGLFLDVFNMLNSNPAQDIVQSSSTTFLRPLTIIAPRIARLGTKFEW
jgi:hypothetical protein